MKRNRRKRVDLYLIEIYKIYMKKKKNKTDFICHMVIN